jgi:hypothetical protein
MNILLRISAIIGGLFGLFIVVALFIFFSTFSDMCGNRISTMMESPKKEWNIVVFERDCGATTDFSTQISILRKNQELPNSAGNIFSADSGHGSAQINEKGVIYVEPLWINSRTISIKYDSEATAFYQENEFNGITIRFERVKVGA